MRKNDRPLVPWVSSYCSHRWTRSGTISGLTNVTVIHPGRCWQSAGPCLRRSAADHSELLAGGRTRRESPRRRWRWPNHKPPAAASETHRSLRGKVKSSEWREVFAENKDKQTNKQLLCPKVEHNTKHLYCWTHMSGCTNLKIQINLQKCWSKGLS